MLSRLTARLSSAFQAFRHLSAEPLFFLALQLYTLACKVEGPAGE